MGMVLEDDDEDVGCDNADLKAEAEEEEEMAYESLLLGPGTDADATETDDMKRRIGVARRRRTEEEEEGQEEEEEWGGTQWEGREVPVCGQLDTMMTGPSKPDLEQVICVGDGAGTSRDLKWQSRAVAAALNDTWKSCQADAATDVEEDWDQGVPNVDVSRYGTEENAELLADAHMSCLLRCLAQPSDTELVDASDKLDPAAWGDLVSRMSSLCRVVVVPCA